MNNFITYSLTTLKGIAIGAANVIPGVSGGTIAFLTGIYERLINALKSFDFASVKLLGKGKFVEFAKKTDLAFLGCIVLGLIISTLSLAKLMVYLLQNFPVATWSFFFGLVLISCYYVIKDIKKWNFGTFLALIIGCAIAVYICLASPTSTPESLWFIALCGAIAICAMILPGISGSFILVLLAKYEYIMNAIGNLDLDIIALFLLGGIIGLVAFSHLLGWLLKKWYYQSIALLTGFMIGSLLKIWPWQDILEGTADKAITRPIMPTDHIGIAIIFAIVGILIVVVIERLANKKV